MTSSTHSPRFDELLPAYSLGALDGDELRELAAHLAAGCPACEGELRRLAAEVEDLAAVAAELSESLVAEAPEILGGVKRRLLAELPRHPRLPERASAPPAAFPSPPAYAARSARSRPPAPRL